MAYTSVQSGEIPEGTQYYSGKLPLGDYNFYLKIDATGVSPQIVAQCESPDGTMRTAASGTWPAGTQVQGWSVEANETEASVYAHLHNDGTGINAIRLVCNVDEGVPPGYSSRMYRTSETWTTGTGVEAALCKPQEGVTWVTHFNGILYAANESGSAAMNQAINVNGHWTYGGSTSGTAGNNVFVGSTAFPDIPIAPESDINPEGHSIDEIDPGFRDAERLIARFAINLGDAGGYPGGGGGWISPGDWNIDPTTTLHLTVNGALSGRHNDPLEHPIYSYLPADNTTEAGYGCGGDGGHGGGGGGGASTIIVRQFATNKANSKDILALAKRHGYGSGGGKGARGGDGCILIYY